MSNVTFDAQKYISQTVKDVPPSGIRQFFDLVSGAKDIISLGVGEPDFVTPRPFINAVVRSLGEGQTMYTSNHGMPELRVEVAKYLNRRFGLDYDGMTDVLITVGASEALDIVLRTLLSPGDEVLVPEPSYVSYQACTVMAGGVAVPIPLTPEDKFQLTAEKLAAKITPKSRLLILNFPCNPTGATLDKEEMKKIAQLAIAHDLIVISDEIYAELHYNGDVAPSIAALPGMHDRTIVISGMSKTYAMTGWRVGYIACHKDFIEAIVKIHQYIIMCAPTMGQIAAIEALRHGERYVNEMREEYDRRRRFIVERVKEIGIPMVTPHGAFYAFPQVGATGLSSHEFATRFLNEYKVAAVPGEAFGKSGQGFLRCSYATAYEDIVEAFERMDRFVQSL